MSRPFQEKLLNFIVSGHIEVDQMRKQYDFKIKGAKLFAACNEITRLSRPLQSRFRRLHLPPYTEDCSSLILWMKEEYEEPVTLFLVSTRKPEQNIGVNHHAAL
jgi:hypothetical protein